MSKTSSTHQRHNRLRAGLIGAHQIKADQSIFKEKTSKHPTNLLTLNMLKVVGRTISRLTQLGTQLKKLNSKRQQPSTRPHENYRTKKASLIAKIVRILLWPITSKLGLAVILGAVLIVAGSLIYIARDLPSPATLTNNDNFDVSTQIFDRNGQLLYEIFADENRIPVNLDQVPPEVIQATIAIEDQRFYSHWGVDMFGITRALLNNLRGQRLEGGSTITQQLVKNALLTNDRTIQRKIKEAILAVLTEFRYSKDQIMEMYLNYVSYGGTAVGIEAAAQYYFDKSVQDLTLAEASLLAGLPQAPSVYSPFGSNPQRAYDRQAEVLRRMVEEEYITELEAESAQAETLTYGLRKTDIQAPHFVFFVRDLLFEEYGEELVTTGGLRVTTSLDLDLQRTAQASVSAEIAELDRFRVGNGAALITKPNTGEILAMVGSKDYWNTAQEGEVNVTIADRQPGSSIKPIMFATAFQERILQPGSILLDVPTCFRIEGQPDYCPRNYDGSFKGSVTVRRALANSLNIPAVRAIRALGVETFIRQANQMGITSWEDPSRYGLSLTLGGGEVKMTELATAFGVLANQGVKVPLSPILKIENFRGEVIAKLDIQARKELVAAMNQDETIEGEGEVERVMNQAPAYLTAHIMQDNQARTEAFGARSELVIPDQIVSAKTGTTNDLKDNWTVGFTPEYLVTTWVGNNDNTPMNQFLVSGVTGAAPIFNDLMSYLLAGEESVWQQKPRDVTSGQLCANGMPAEFTQGGCAAVGNEELYWTNGAPSTSAKVTEETWIDPTTGLPPAPNQQVDGLVLETRTFLTDPVTSRYCEDCSRPVNEDGEVQWNQVVVE